MNKICRPWFLLTESKRITRRKMSAGLPSRKLHSSSSSRIARSSEKLATGPRASSRRLLPAAVTSTRHEAATESGPRLTSPSRSSLRMTFDTVFTSIRRRLATLTWLTQSPASRVSLSVAYSTLHCGNEEPSALSSRFKRRPTSRTRIQCSREASVAMSVEVSSSWRFCAIGGVQTSTALVIFTSSATCMPEPSRDFCRSNRAEAPEPRWPPRGACPPSVTVTRPRELQAQNDCGAHLAEPAPTKAAEPPPASCPTAPFVCAVQVRTVIQLARRPTNQSSGAEPNFGVVRHVSLDSGAIWRSAGGMLLNTRTYLKCIR